MKGSESPSLSIPQHDYGLAVKSAVSWLVDRYLLADPLPRRREERKDRFGGRAKTAATSTPALS